MLIFIKKEGEEMSVIKVNHATKDYGHGRGIFDVSFKVEKGEAFGFLGPNGAGKSTTIRHLMGFSKLDDGELSINGKNSWKSAANIKNDVGYLPGELAFPKGMTGDQFIEYMAKERQLIDMTRTKELKEIFEVDSSKKIKEMSLGMKRKLAVVTAFMHSPRILILDEPTSGLDPVMQERFIQFILKEKAEGKTILLSSHIFTEVEATCDRIAIIKDGVVVSTVKAEALKKNTNKSFKIEFNSFKDYQTFIENTAFTLSVKRPKQNQVKLSLTDQKMQQLFVELSEVKLKFISEIKFTLEDYFMDFYDRKKTVAAGEENLQDGLH